MKVTRDEYEPLSFGTTSLSPVALRVRPAPPPALVVDDDDDDELPEIADDAEGPRGGDADDELIEDEPRRGLG